MGRNPGPELSRTVMKYGIEYVRPYHLEIARRLVLGQRQADIARCLGISQGRLSIICNSPLFKIELKRLEEARDAGTADVTKTLREISPVALEVVERTMLFGETGSLRLSAAESILDRAGYGRTSKTQVDFRGNLNLAAMTDTELRQLVVERANRIKKEVEERKRLEAEAEAIAVNFEECPTDGHEENSDNGGNGDGSG